MKNLIITAIAMTLIVSGAAWAAPQTTGARADTDPATANNQSTQPVSDTWITTKVKADLMASRGVPGTEIEVETVNGVVRLSGRVDRAQADKAVSIAKSIDGVKKVDSSGLATQGPRK